MPTKAYAMQGFTYNRIQEDLKLRDEYFSLYRLHIKLLRKEGFHKAADIEMRTYNRVKEALEFDD